MKKIYLLFLLMIAAVCGYANNVVISNASIINNGPNNLVVQFDVTWDHSWRVNVGPANYDGVWVFFKYKNSAGVWNHILLTNTNNSIPFGFSVYETSNFQPTGAMLYRSANGAGTSTLTGVQLGISSTLPYDVDIKGFAVEMVYVPAPGHRPFFGDGDGTSESPAAFHYAANTATTGSVLPMLSSGAGGDDIELTSHGIYVYSNDTIQKTSPLGSLDPFPTFKAFWCMKYEMSQAGYRDFLNTLTVTQQAARTGVATTSSAGTFINTGGSSYRNYIKVATPSSGTTPAVYGCDANNNGTYDETGDGEWIACNYLSWNDEAAYLDWAGMAPMSEFQYEFSCRGVSSAGANPASYQELAWGSAALCGSIYALTNTAQTGEAATNSCSSGGGNANVYYTNSTIQAPFRNGIFATGTTNRINSGATYYGIMEMTGNLMEYTIQVGSAAGRSCRYVPNGNGDLSANGNAQLSVGGAGFWPGMEGNNSASTVNTCSGTCEVTGVAGIFTRGGNFSYNTTYCTIATRYFAGSYGSRLSTYGCRGVLNIR